MPPTGASGRPYPADRTLESVGLAGQSSAPIARNAAAAGSYHTQVDVYLKLSEYSEFMAARTSFITIKLDFEDPVEANDFAVFWSSIASQFERFIRTQHTNLPAEGRIFIKEVRRGSIEADIIPVLGNLIDYMDQVVIVTTFLGMVGATLRKYINGSRNYGAGKSDIQDYLGTVRAIANDSNGRAVIESATYEQGVLRKRVEFTFTTEEAREAAKHIEYHKQDLDRVASADHPRVLMLFKRSDIGSAEIGKRSGERVIIEAISPKDLPLVYASPLAEERIKHEMRTSDENIYKKGFWVDVNVQTRGGRTIAYAVTEVHSIIDVPDEDED